jgi:hypothetical protein
MKNNVLDANYSILLDRLWLRNAKVSHDWGTNLITNEDKGIVISIVVTKRLDGTIKHEVLLRHDFVNGIINERNFFCLLHNLIHPPLEQSNCPWTLYLNLLVLILLNLKRNFSILKDPFW